MNPTFRVESMIKNWNKTTVVIIGGLFLSAALWQRSDSSPFGSKPTSERPDSSGLRQVVTAGSSVEVPPEAIDDPPVMRDVPTLDGTSDMSSRTDPNYGWTTNPYRTFSGELRPENREATPTQLTQRSSTSESKFESLLAPEPSAATDARRGRPLARPIDGAGGNTVLNELVSQKLPGVPVTHVIPPPTEQVLTKLARGESLARRGATATARREFHEVLSIIAQHNDSVRQNTSASAGLQQAFLALDEAEDFFATPSSGSIDVPAKVLRHSSQVLSPREAEGLTAIAAAQMYYGYARKMFRECFLHDPIASRALYCLGKLHAVAAADQTLAAPTYARVMLLHYAALDCDSTNYPAANELGVMLAKGGRLAEARDALQLSVNIQPTLAGLQNLARVQEKMGDTHGAQITSARAQALEDGTEPGVLSDKFKLVDLRTFNEIPDHSGDLTRGPSSGTNIPVSTGSTSDTPTKKGKRWFMWR